MPINFLLNLKQHTTNLSFSLQEDVIDHSILFKSIEGKKKLLFSVTLLLVVGTMGYMVIEGWSWLDSLYMVIITITTIGYGEVGGPMSSVGRIFTMGLIMVGVIAGSYAVSTIVESLTSQQFRDEKRSLKKQRGLQRIAQHCIICGCGRLGSSLANEMRARQSPLIVIDTNLKVVEKCELLGIPVVMGNAADEKILAEAGIERASSLVTVADSDAENVFIILSARALNPNLKIISRCNSEASISKLKAAGAHTVISPYVIAGRRIAHMLLNPRVTEFLDGVLEIGHQRLRLEEFEIGENSSLIGLTLRESKLKVAVLGVLPRNDDFISMPTADTKFAIGDAVVVMGVEQRLRDFAELVNN